MNQLCSPNCSCFDCLDRRRLFRHLGNSEDSFWYTARLMFYSTVAVLFIGAAMWGGILLLLRLQK